MAVVLLLALVLTTATVQLDGVLPLSRSESAARQMLSVLDLARTSAVSMGLPFEVEVYLEEDRYRIRTPFDEEGQIARDPELRTGLSWNKLPSGVHFSGVMDSRMILRDEGVYRLRFSQLGSADEIFLYLENEAGVNYDMTLRVLALTGTSSVLHGRIAPQELSEDVF